MRFRPHDGDALVVVDLQLDFVSGNLAVPRAHEIVPIVNRYVGAFAVLGLPVVATRDWHPPDHVSFAGQGGRWPPHCVAGTLGAAFAPGFLLPEGAFVVSKATTADADAYSAFDGTALDAELRHLGVRRLFVGGLATDYCVLETVRDALRLRYAVVLLADAIRAVDAQPGDGERAEHAMLLAGAEAMDLAELEAPEAVDG